MKTIGQTFRAHVMAQSLEWCDIRQVDDDHITLETQGARGEVNFYAFDDMPEIVELKVVDVDGGDPKFFLHFELVNEARAEELFAEMVGELAEEDLYDTTRVLLCCTAGMTTSMFAAKLNEAAKTLSLDYSFEAIPLEQAKDEHAHWDAILLAPQVGYQRKAVSETFPDAVVVEIPPKIFATFDAGAALKMVMHLLSDHTVFPQADSSNLKFVRGVRNDRRIMTITCIKRPRSAWTGWRIYERDEVVASGHFVRAKHDVRNIEDLVASLPAQGHRVKDLDAIGIAVPGIVRRGCVTVEGYGDGDYDLGHCLAKRYGVKVFVENNARAAAVGCYVSQNDYDSLVFHTQQTGYPVGGQGIIVDGHLSKGRRSFAGEIGPLVQTQRQKDQDKDAAWTPEGMRGIVARSLAADVSLVAPDAIYVACDLVDDMDDLRDELRPYFLGYEDFIPDLIRVSDYRERVAFGMLALCLQKLHNPRPHRKH